MICIAQPYPTQYQQQCADGEIIAECAECRDPIYMDDDFSLIPGPEGKVLCSKCERERCKGE